MEFLSDGLSRAFLMSEPLKRDTYVKLPDWAEKGNVSRVLLNPLYGLSTACKEWCETIRDFLAKECVGKVTSLDKSVFFWTQKRVRI